MRACVAGAQCCCCFVLLFFVCVCVSVWGSAVSRSLSVSLCTCVCASFLLSLAISLSLSLDMCMCDVCPPVRACVCVCAPVLACQHLCGLFASVLVSAEERVQLRTQLPPDMVQRHQDLLGRGCTRSCRYHGGMDMSGIGLPLVSREWKNGSSYNCTPFLHSLLTKGT